VASTDWKSYLRQRGYRLTPQRQLVLEAVGSLEHATPDGILCEVRKTASGVNISTVYRTLELLEELGLVSHAHLGHGAPTYHLADRHDHMHLVCRDCDAVTEAGVELAVSLREGLRARFGFETDMKHFAIFGRCQDCARKARARAESESESEAGSEAGSDTGAGAGGEGGFGSGGGSGGRAPGGGAVRGDGDRGARPGG
jgi:Fur family transcriptional regulator, ferric uptake regulator